MGVHVGGAFNQAVSAAGKAHQRQPQILRLNVIMLQIVGIGHDLGHFIAHHPAQQINIMDALVHQRAAVLGPGAPPGSLLVIAGAPVPADMGRAVQHPAKAALFHRVPDFLNGFVKPVLVAGAQLQAPPVRLGDQTARVRQGKGQRLFDNHMTARPQHVQTNGGVPAASRSHGAQFRPLLFQHLPVVGIAAHPGPPLLRQRGEHRLHPFRNRVAHGAQIQRTGVVHNGGNMVGRDAAAADQPIADWITHTVTPYSTRMF